MKHLFGIFVVIISCLVGGLSAAEKPRMIVLTDIGGDPDDQQAMVRLLLYSNEIDIEALIASSCVRPADGALFVTKPFLIEEIVDAYGAVRSNLYLHSASYPTHSYLLGRIKTGNPNRGSAYIGSGHDTEGSNYIINVVDKSDPRPVNITIWGGQTDLAQALWKVESTRSSSAYSSFIQKLRIHATGDQDGIYAQMLTDHPKLWFIKSQAPAGVDARESVYRGMYLGGDESLTSRTWLNANVIIGHGSLGALYPDTTYTSPNPYGALKEGDTPAWFYFLNNGLGSHDDPSYGSWGGRFKKDASIGTGSWFIDDKDSVGGITNARVTVSRWRPAYQNDFKARMDWCVKPFANANHQPSANISLGEAVTVGSGGTVALDASGSSDPDGDSLSYKWFQYKEAGSYGGSVSISGSSTATAGFVAPSVTAEKTIHIILEVTDYGAPALTAYKRLIVTVQPGLSAPASVITSPTPATVFQPGLVVTATGTGENLSWEIDLIGDGLPAFAAGSGSQITFTVPANATPAQTVELQLQGNGGTTSQSHAIEVDDNPVCTPDCSGKPCGADDGCGTPCTAGCPTNDAGVFTDGSLEDGSVGPVFSEAGLALEGGTQQDAGASKDSVGSLKPRETSGSGCSCRLGDDGQETSSTLFFALGVALLAIVRRRSRQC